MALSPELQKALQGISTLPSPASVALKIVELAEQPDPDLEAVARVIAVDPALTSKILRIANSSLYARRRTSQNLRQALILLGMHATMTMALSFSLVTSLNRGPRSKLQLRLYWQRALLAAMSARALGQRLGRHDTEELFLAALLQDIGVLVIDQAFPEAYADCEAMQADHARLAEAEVGHLGADHAAVGGWLLQTWHMPPAISAAVEASHDLDGAGVAEADRPFAQVVSLSGLLADVWLCGEGGGPALRAAAEAERAFGLDRQAVGEVMGKVREQVPLIESLFEVEVLVQSQAEAILERAREILMVRNLLALQEVSTLRETTRSLESRARELEEAARRDNLTGAYNRAFLDDRLSVELSAARENNWPLSVLFADLDRFKQINDTHGHLVGDHILREAARLLVDCTRKDDLVARYGGEEFVVILPGSGREAARVVAERIVGVFQKARHAVEGGQALTVTVSVGLATHDQLTRYETVEGLLEAADKAVYAAKMQGRNRVAEFTAGLAVHPSRSRRSGVLPLVPSA